jgi:hypothetical protein
VSSQSPQISIVEPSIWIGDIPPYSTIDIKISLYITPALMGSITSLYLRINYVDECGLNRVFTSTIYLLIKQPKPPQIMLKISPTTIIAGIKNNITVTIINNGSTAIKEVAVSFDFPQQIILVNGTSKWFIDELKPYSTSNISFILTSLGVSSDKTVSQILATVSYRDQYGIDRSDKITTALTIIKPQTLIDIDIEPRNLTPGRINELILSVSNIGNVSIYGLDLSITLPQPLIFRDFDGKWYIGDLKPNDTKNITLLFIVPSTTSTVQITITYSYIDVGGGSRSETRVIGLEVKQPLINIAVEIEPQILSIGENNITIYIKNKGESSIYNTVIEFSIPQQIVLLRSDGKVYIGEIKPNETKTLPLKIAIVSEITTIQIPITIRYTDIAGLSRNENRVLSFRIAARSTTPNFKISIEPNTIVSGRQSKLKLAIANIANRRLDNITVTISSTTIALIGFDGKWFIDSLNPSEVRSMELMVYINPVQITQSIATTITLTYIDTSTGNSISEATSLTIIAMPNTLKEPLEITVYPQILVAGRVNNLTLSIRNPNNFNVSSTTLSVTSPTGTILLAPDTYFISLLKPNDRKDIELSLYIPSTSVTTLSLPISISYFDGTATNTFSKNIAFLIALPPLLKITNYAVLPQTISSGQTFSVSLTIANIGLGSAYNVTAMALPSQFYTPLLGSETFIGEISKGASTTITFSFRTSSQLNVTVPRPSNITRPFNATRTFPTIARNITYPQYGGLQPRVTILITYMDNVGRLYNLTFSIPLIIASSNTATITTHISEGIFNINIALILVAIAVIVTVTYVIIRLRKR